MVKVTDWISLWRELTEMQALRWKIENRPAAQDPWRDRARGFQSQVGRRWARPDSSRAFVAAQLAASPGATLLDIGAGTGAWAAYLSRYAATITALEPSRAMLDIMRQHLAGEAVTNVDIVQDSWPEASVGMHDFSLCSHAMYGYPDLPAFIRRMEDVTRHYCMLLMRAPLPSSVLSEVAQKVWGHPYDSPNFHVAYGVLLQMGILANVLVEDSGPWPPRTSSSLEEAVGEVKRRLALTTSEHDEYLQELLSCRLTPLAGQYIWPPDVRSVMVYWTPSHST